MEVLLVLVFGIVILVGEVTCTQKFEARLDAEHIICAKVCAPNPTLGMRDNKCICNTGITIKGIK